jgi:ParB/RepB/Spo0J family partition protein
VAFVKVNLTEKENLRMNSVNPMSAPVLSSPQALPLVNGGDAASPQHGGSFNNMHAAPEVLDDHPFYDAKSQKPIPTYVLMHKHPSWLLPVKVDKRVRTGAEYVEHFARFTDDVRARGVMQPIIAERKGDLAVVVDGETRRLAALIAGCMVPILVYDHPLSESDLIVAQLQSNEMRMEFSDLERAQIYAKLMELNGWNQAELARFINVSRAQVSKVMRISKNLPEEILALIGEGEGQIPPSSAYHLSRLSAPEAMKEMAEQIVKGLLCRDAVGAAVADCLGKRKGVKKQQKPVKVVMEGVTVIIAVEELKKVFAVLKVLDAGLKKLETHGLPLASLPSLIKA